jgi:hypothetical protein
MMIRPYKPRDSARSALLTAVRNRRSGPAAPARPATGAAKYAWGARGRSVDAKIDEEFRLRVAHDKVRLIAPTGRAEGVRGTNAKEGPVRTGRC